MISIVDYRLSLHVVVSGEWRGLTTRVIIIKDIIITVSDTASSLYVYLSSYSIRVFKDVLSF